MKTFELTIRPGGGFGTPLKGDTLFGHVCWQAAQDPGLLGKPLSELLGDYHEQPFLIVSSAIPVLPGPRNGRSLVLRRPFGLKDKEEGKAITDSTAFRTMIKNRKTLKKQVWMLVDEEHPVRARPPEELLSEAMVVERVLATLRPDDPFRHTARRRGTGSLTLESGHPRNAINRWTGTTGAEPFTPFLQAETRYLPGLRLSVVVGVREDLRESSVRAAFERIGAVGFGRDASTGLGRFTVEDCRPIDLGRLGDPGGEGRLTLGPCLPLPQEAKRVSFTPFVRFGRHGGQRALSAQPFKNPVLLAEEGAIFVAAGGKADRPWLGQAFTGLSRFTDTVGQGYSLFIPVQIGGH